ncbi:double zinc ribbon domain-containing protein [Eisenbergiella porci]|nr:zinc ribbon domain-containing protein [Eisenbergiella porci]
MVVCPACQALNQEGLRFCTQCGSLLEPEPAKEAGEKPARKCPVCGAEMKDGFVFCGCCGAKIAE